MIRARPPAEIVIDAALVRALIEEQHPDLASLPIANAGEGWDNRLFRLGAGLLVRLPRRAAAAANIDRERQWLPQVAPGLPLPVPTIRRAGRPGCGYPWSWSIVAWIAGEPALSAPVADPEAAALALGGFLRALHQPAPQNAPLNPARSVPLTARTPVLREHLDRLQGAVDGRAVLDLWQAVLEAPRFPGPPVWIHGDLHPGNLIVEDGRLSGVIDFGDLTSGIQRPTSPWRG
jgi:aminoglycoside phosphotransferase (APT) family kinase protein